MSDGVDILQPWNTLQNPSRGDIIILDNSMHFFYGYHGSCSTIF
jgi:hypothetical protein